MPADDLQSDRPYYWAAAASLLLPGLGQLLRRQPNQALVVCAGTAGLFACAAAIGRAGGTPAGIFFLLMVVLPWWALQSYAAALPDTPGTSPGLGRSLRRAWAQAHDIRFLGLLFLVTAFTDLYIIVTQPAYALTVFCAKPAGWLGVLAKAQSPTLHTLIGYGFLRLRRWSLFLYMVYAAFGFLNATANYACCGYGRIRTVFVVTLVGFTLYVALRARRFER